MNQQETEPEGGLAGCLGLVLSIGIVAVSMIAIGNTVGFNGFLSITGGLIVSLIAGFLFFVIYSLVFFRSDSAKKPSAVAGTTSAARSKSRWEAANANPLVGRVRLYDRELSHKVKAFQKAAAERPEFSEDDAQRVLNHVKEMNTHQEAYQHILTDDGHPDHSIVTQEMNKYRSAVGNLLQLRTRELQSGTFGGFDYRDSFRAVEGEVELLNDEFNGLFEELEADRGRRGEEEPSQ